MNAGLIILIVSFIVLGVVAAIAGTIRQRKLKKQLEAGEIEAIPDVVEPPVECCGSHEICEADSLLAAVSTKIEYYDDEDLDRFRGRTSEEYSEDESEEFRDVLYTMESDEVAGWVRSLQHREVELPNDVKEEVLMIVGERRV